MDLLFDFFTTLENEFNNDIFSLKTKIINKINIIKRLYSMYIVPDFTTNDMIHLVKELKRLFENSINQSNMLSIKKYYDIMNKRLGGVLHNMYSRSGYHILLRNIPKIGKPKDLDEKELITSQHIYETLVNVFGDGYISNVLQVDDTTYLVKVFTYDEQAKFITDRIDSKQIEDKIIKATIIEKKKSDLDSIDIDDNIHIKEDSLSDSWSQRMFKYACSFVNKVKGLALSIY